MKTTVENGELVIRIPLKKGKPSKSGATLIVASTGGGVQTNAVTENCNITVSLNAWIKP